MPLMHDQGLPTREDERLGFLFAVAQHPMLILERGGELSQSPILDCNQQAVALFGYPRERLIGQSFSFLELPAAERDADRDDGADRVETGDDALYRHANGQVIVAERSFQEIESGGQSLLLVSFRDVTTSRLLEKAILRIQQMDNLGLVSGTLVHDFRNLLVAILANAELALAEPEDGAEMRERVAEIANSARRATDLVDRFLPSGGGIDSRLEVLDLNEVVSDAVGLMRPVIPEGIVIDVRTHTTPLRMSGDPIQIRQVVMNLLLNATEAVSADNGKIRIATGLTPAQLIDVTTALPAITDPVGEWAYVEVADNGTGIDAESRDRIFEPLFTTKSSGTGLGLTAVAFAVRRHQGTLTLRSAAGKGAAFQALFPLHEEG